MDAGDSLSVPSSSVPRPSSSVPRPSIPIAQHREQRRSARASAAFPFAVLICVLALGAVTRATPERATLFGLEGPVCPSTYVLRNIVPLGDVGCPGCGLTRGTALLLDGQFDAATRLQPAAWLVVLFAACGAALHGAVLATGRKSEWTERLLRSGRVAFLAGLLAVWLARLV